MSVLVVATDATWSRQRCAGAGARAVLCRHLHSPGEAVPLTPTVCLWVGRQHDEDGRAAQPNALASALVAFLQLPVRQLRGTACITGWSDQRARPLTAVQDTAFAQVLRAVQSMPAYLALHAQAGRVAAAWHFTENQTDPETDSRSMP